jgi:hypothetical protein
VPGQVSAASGNSGQAAPLLTETRLAPGCRMFHVKHQGSGLRGTDTQAIGYRSSMVRTHDRVGSKVERSAPRGGLPYPDTKTCRGMRRDFGAAMPCPASCSRSPYPEFASQVIPGGYGASGVDEASGLSEPSRGRSVPIGSPVRGIPSAGADLFRERAGWFSAPPTVVASGYSDGGIGCRKKASRRRRA